MNTLQARPLARALASHPMAGEAMAAAALAAPPRSDGPKVRAALIAAGLLRPPGTGRPSRVGGPIVSTPRPGVLALDDDARRVTRREREAREDRERRAAW